LFVPPELETLDKLFQRVSSRRYFADEHPIVDQHRSSSWLNDKRFGLWQGASEGDSFKKTLEVWKNNVCGEIIFSDGPSIVFDNGTHLDFLILIGN
jgi:hypothetical protein